MSRKPIGDIAMTDAERQRRRRDRAKALRAATAKPVNPTIQSAPVQRACTPSPTAADFLAGDAETIAARIFDSMPADKAANVASALQRWVWQGRPRIS